MTKPSTTSAARSTVTLHRSDLVRALHAAADVYQNTAAVAKSQEWQTHFHDAMTEYRNAASMIERGAKLSIKA